VPEEKDKARTQDAATTLRGQCHSSSWRCQQRPLLIITRSSLSQDLLHYREDERREMEGTMAKIASLV
jgi:hypothetical protein